MASTNFKIVTVICEPVLSNMILSLIKSMGASGFTATDVRGEGSGEKNSGEVPNEKVKIEVIADSNLAESLMLEISKTYFENYSIILYAHDIQVIRQEKF